MPTPHMSRATSGPSPGYTAGDEICDVSCPIDWDTNVVNFISTCLHPGLVRRTSSSTTYGLDKPNHFRRQHRRNLSTATTVGFGRYPDHQIASRIPYSNALNHPNDHQASPSYYSKRILGHARNISDPTSGWDFRIVTKPLILDQLTERPSYNWDDSVEQNLVVSGEHKIPATSLIPETKPEAYPCLTPPRLSDDATLEKSFVCTRDTETHVTTIVKNDDTACLCPCLQTCASPRVVLVGLCLTMFMQTMVVSGLMSSMFTTLERRFNLTSRQIGYMISVYEVAGVITTVIVSFISGQKHNRLRFIGLATLILALGFGLFTLPHFLAGPYRPNLLTTGDNNTAISISTDDMLMHSSLSSSFPIDQDSENSIQLDGPLCIDQSRHTVAQNVVFTSFNNQINVSDPIIRAASLTTTDKFNNNNNNNNESLSTGFIDSNAIVQSVLFPTFCIAMLLAGIGASPLYVLAPTYLWDNLTDRQYPIYAALFYSAGGLGPAFGFLAGAGFLSIYIDSPFMLPETGLDRNNPLWLGAWWLGMLVCAVLTFFVALPVICLPKQLAIIKNNDNNTISNDEMEDNDKTNCSSTIQHNNYNIYNQNTNDNNNVNLSYIKSSDNLPNLNKQFNQPPPLTVTTTITGPVVNTVTDVKTSTSSHLIDITSSTSSSSNNRTVQYPSLEEFKQQRNNVDLCKTTTQSSSIPPLHEPPSPYISHSVVVNGDGTTVTATNVHLYSSQSNTSGGHYDSSNCNTFKVVNSNIVVGDGQQSGNLENSIKTSLNNNNNNNSFCENQTKIKSKIKASYLVVRRVLTNPIWLGVTLSTVVEQSIVAAFLTFAAKYIQILFHIPAYLASIHTGAVIVPSSLLGVLSGALLMRHFRPTLHRTLSGLCIMIALTVITSISLMSIGCHSSRVAGITATYNGENWPWKNGPGFLIPPNLTAPCNQFCYSSTDRLKKLGHSHYSQRYESQCSITHYNPVCWTAITTTTAARSRSSNGKKKTNNQMTCHSSVVGSNSNDPGSSNDNDNDDDDCDDIESLTFFNPCFAGCRTRVLEAGVVKKYSDCQCVTPSALNPSGLLSSISSSYSSASQPLPSSTMGINNEFLLVNNSGEVYPGRCKLKCTLYGLFLAMLFLHILCTGILQNPSNVITLSCVASEDSSVALGLQIFFVKILAYIPAPIYFGQLFDLACQYRSNPVDQYYSSIPIDNNELLLVNRNISSLMSLPTTTTVLSSLQNSSISTSSASSPSILSPVYSSSSATTASTMSLDQKYATTTTTTAGGGCLEYNLEGLPFIWLGTVCALKIISLIGSTITWWLAKRQFDLTTKHKEQQQQQQHQQNLEDGETKKEMEISLNEKIIPDPNSIINNHKINSNNNNNNNSSELMDSMLNGHQIQIV